MTGVDSGARPSTPVSCKVFRAIWQYIEGNQTKSKQSSKNGGVEVGKNIASRTESMMRMILFQIQFFRRSDASFKYTRGNVCCALMSKIKNKRDRVSMIIADMRAYDIFM